MGVKCCSTAPAQPSATFSLLCLGVVLSWVAPVSTTEAIGRHWRVSDGCVQPWYFISKPSIRLFYTQLIVNPAGASNLLCPRNKCKQYSQNIYATPVPTPGHFSSMLGISKKYFWLGKFPLFFFRSFMSRWKFCWHDLINSWNSSFHFFYSMNSGVWVKPENWNGYLFLSRWILENCSGN